MSDDPKVDEVAQHIREIEAKAEHMPSVGAGAPLPASRVGLDFTMSVLGGLLLGWLVDMAVPSIAPWPLWGLFAAGLISGFLNMWRSFSGQSYNKPVR